MSEPDVRPYRAGDEAALVDLFHRSFGHRITVDHWRWKLRGRRSTVDNVWLAAAPAENPVFHYAGIPNRFWLSNTEVISMVAADAMTAPECRRRGLLTRVVPQVHAVWREGGIAFVLGLPNDQWGSRTRAVGWQRLFPLQWLIRPLRLASLLSRRLQVPLLDRTSAMDGQWNRFYERRMRRDPTVCTRRVIAADESFDRLWESCRRDSMYSTVRDRAWVDWRFLAAPSRTYVVTMAHRGGEPVGYSAHCLFEAEKRTSAILAEIFTAKDDRAGRDTLLHELIRDLLASGADSLATLGIPGTAHFRWLRDVGFIPRHAFSVALIPLASHLPLASMRSPENWNLGGADFDVV